MFGNLALFRSEKQNPLIFVSLDKMPINHHTAALKQKPHQFEVGGVGYV